MTASTWPRVLTLLRRGSFGLLTACLLAGVTLAFAPKREDTLLVWASDKAHVAPDFIAVIDFERESPTYGTGPAYRAALRSRMRSATSRITSASPATDGRWRSAAC